MGRKTTAIQILLSLESVCNVNIRDFAYKMTTGRLLNDYDIMKELGASTLSDAFSEINRYTRTYRGMLKEASMSELKKKGWITPTSIAKAKRIVAFMEMKKGTHVKKGTHIKIRR